MSILGVLWHNALRRARTRTVADTVPRPAGFRGMIEHDASLCTGCTACAHVCAPKAISFDVVDGRSVTWKFFAGQCSFCGLCVQYCPTRAISNSGKLAEVTGDQSLHRVAHTVEYQSCSQCGRPVIPLPRPVLEQLYDRPLAQSMHDQQSLCDGCRRRDASRGLRDAFLGSRTSGGTPT